MSDGVLFIDNSTMKATARCSTEAFVRYAPQTGYVATEERAPLRCGIAAHEALAAWFRGGTKMDVLTKYSEEYEAYAEENVPPDDRLSYLNTSRILDHWLDTHALTSFPFRIANPEFVEIGFSLPLTDDGDIVFCGRIDAIAVGREDRAMYIVEHKTTGRITPTWLEGFRMDSQLSGYIWAARQHAGAPVIGAFLNAIEFSKLPGSDRKCSTHAVHYSECGHLHAAYDLSIVQRTDEELIEWKRTAIHLARRFQDLCRKFPAMKDVHRVRTQGKFHNACTWCAFKNWCSIGRPLNLVDSMLVREPWDPLAYSRGEADTTAKKP